MSAIALDLSVSTRFRHSLPSSIGLYLRRIIEFGPFRQTMQAVRFAKRLLTYQRSNSAITYPSILTRCKIRRTEVNKKKKVHEAVGYLGSASSSSSKIFTNGMPTARETATHNTAGVGKDGFTGRVPAIKILAGARDKLIETRKCRSSLSKRVTIELRRKLADSSSEDSSAVLLAMDVDCNSMEVDDACPSSTSSSASSSRPLTRSESMVYYSVMTGVSIVHNKRKVQCTSPEAANTQMKRLCLSVSVNAAPMPSLPLISNESVLSWIRSQPSVHYLTAERLKAYFMPSSVSGKLRHSRMRNLASIVKGVASVIRSPYSGDGSQHWLVLKDDELQAAIAPHLCYEQTVAHLILNRSVRGSTQKVDVSTDQPRRRSPLVNEL